jgi:Protein of unknown function (DUF2887)
VNQLQNTTDLQNQAIIQLLTAVMVYKFPELSWEAIETMFGVSELKKTAFIKKHCKRVNSWVSPRLFCDFSPLASENSPQKRDRRFRLYLYSN